MRPKLKLADPGDGSERCYIGAKSVRWEEFQAEQARRLDRDDFARAALTGLLAGLLSRDQVIPPRHRDLVYQAYRLSDEMMEWREEDLVGTAEGGDRLAEAAEADRLMDSFDEAKERRSKAMMEQREEESE